MVHLAVLEAFSTKGLKYSADLVDSLITSFRLTCCTETLLVADAIIPQGGFESLPLSLPVNDASRAKCYTTNPSNLSNRWRH